MSQQPENETPMDDSHAPYSAFGCIIMLMIGAVILIGVVSLPVYFIPNAVGQSFVDALVAVDAESAIERLCPDTSIGEIGTTMIAEGGDLVQPFVRATTGQFGSRLSGVLQSLGAGAVRVESSYNVFSSAYTFRFVFDTGIENPLLRINAGMFSPDVTLNIRRNFTSFSACVAA